MKIKLVIFDVDGTLLDTSQYVLRAFEYALTSHEYRFDESHLIKLSGRPLDETYRILTGKENVESLVTFHREFQKKHPELSFPFENTLSTLQSLKDNNISVASVTSRAGDSTKHTLEKDHIFHLLDEFISVEDVKVPKPDPEGINMILKKLAIAPIEAVMIGDTEADILAGKNAGTKTAGAMYGMKGDILKELKPDYLLEDISEILEVVI